MADGRTMMGRNPRDHARLMGNFGGRSPAIPREIVGKAGDPVFCRSMIARVKVRNAGDRGVGFLVRANLFIYDIELDIRIVWPSGIAAGAPAIPREWSNAELDQGVAEKWIPRFLGIVEMIPRVGESAVLVEPNLKTLFCGKVVENQGLPRPTCVTVWHRATFGSVPTHNRAARINEHKEPCQP